MLFVCSLLFNFSVDLLVVGSYDIRLLIIAYRVDVIEERKGANICIFVKDVL